MCARCELLEVQVENLRHELERVKDAWAVDVGNADTDRRVLQRKVTMLRNELDGKRKEDPQAKEIAELLKYAKEQWGKNKRWAIDPGGDRWTLTLKQLKRPAYNFDVLKTCIDGLTREPFVGPRGRASEQYPGSEKLVDITYAYGTDERIRAWLDKAERALNPKPAVAPVPMVTQLRRERQPSVWQEPIHLVLGALEARGLRWRPGQADTWSAQCPAHDDRDPSLSIRMVDDGAVLLHCFAGCPNDEVVAALGLAFSDLFSEARRAA